MTVNVQETIAVRQCGILRYVLTGTTAAETVRSYAEQKEVAR
jgi:hypothetical protein